MAFVYKPVIVRKRDGRRRRQRGPYYWAEYRDATGRIVRRKLKLPDDRGITDKAVAASELRKPVKRIEREQAGLTNPHVQAASTSVRKFVADYVRHLRRRRTSRDHVKFTIHVGKWLTETTKIDRVGQLTRSE